MPVQQSSPAGHSPAEHSSGARQARSCVQTTLRKKTMNITNYCISLFVALLFSDCASADTWWQVRTDNLRLISNMNRNVTRDVARGLVLFDGAIGEVMQSTDSPPSAPIT